MPTAYVLNIARAGLAVMRSLGRAGLPVVGIDANPRHPGFASRFGCTVRGPHPTHEADAFARFLLDLAKDDAVPGLLSPASDSTVLFVSRYRELLAERFRFNLPPASLMEKIVDKRGLYELCEQHGVPTAATFYPTSMDDVRAIRHEIQYPALIKPSLSHIWLERFPGEKGFKVFSAEELVARYEVVFAAGLEAMVQSIIEGPASNVRTVYMYIDQQGELLGHLTTRKIRQFPVEFGYGSLAETFHDPEFARMGLEFFRAIGYRGFGTIEFKRDERDGILKATDLNARWVGPLALPIRAGVDFPLLHYQDLAGLEPAPQLDYRAGVRWVNGSTDFASSWWHYRQGTLSPAEWLRSYRGVQAHDSFAWDDPGPFFKEYEYGLKLLRIPLNMWRQR